MRRSTSVRVRTVVVLPVPPFWERTASVEPIGQRTINRESGPRKTVLLPDGSPDSSSRDPPIPLLPAPPGKGLEGALFDAAPEARARLAGVGVEIVHAVAPDDDLVAVGQRAPFDAR